MGTWSLESWNHKRLGDGRWRLVGEAMVGSIVSTSENKKGGRRGGTESRPHGSEGGGVSVPSKANVLA